MKPDSQTSPVRKLAQTTGRWLPKNQADLAPVRQRILQTLLLGGVILGGLVLPPSGLLLIQEGKAGVFVFDLVVYVFIFALFLARNIPYRTRAWGVLSILYLMGLGLLYMLGPFRAGLFYLFTFQVLAAVLLGAGAAIAALVLNLASLLAAGVMISLSLMPISADGKPPVLLFGVVSANFMLLSVLTTIFLLILLRSLEAALDEARSSHNRLWASYAQLEKSNDRLMDQMAESKRADLRLQEAQKQLEQRVRERTSALARSRAMLRLVTDNIPQFVFWKDLDQVYSGCNRNFARWAGMEDPEDIVGLTDDDLGWDEEDFVQLQEAAARVMDRDTPEYRVTRTYRGAGGGNRWLETNLVPLHDESDRVVGVLGAYEDVTSRVMAERALVASEEKYRTILQSIEEGYYEVDTEGNLTFFNEAMCRILGYSKKELYGTNIARFTPEDSEKQVRQVFSGMYRSGQTTRMADYQVKTKSGVSRTLELSASPIVDHDLKRVGARGLVRDVTEILAAEQEKIELQKRLNEAQKLESLGTLAGGVAHDFNNILMGLQGNVSLMLLDVDAGHPHRARLKDMEEHVRVASGLTRQLLGFSRSGKYQVRATDLTDLIQKTASMFGRTKKEIQINQEGLGPVRPVEVDQSQMEQVFLNLLVNAWQAMSKGGEIILAVEDRDLLPKDAAPLGLSAGPYVRAMVRDTGTGIKDGDLSRVFDPFFTTKDMGRGTGLGLASAYGIVKNHNGIITARSREGRGASFFVWLPATQNPAEEKREDPGRILPGTESVLLIDDEPAILETGSDMLKSLGYRVFSANGGPAGLEILERERGLELVILDMIMPGMGGVECFDAIKKIAPSVRVLLSSGYSIEGQATQIMEKGCDGFIQKPFNLEKLSAAVREVLDKNSPQK